MFTTYVKVNLRTEQEDRKGNGWKCVGPNGIDALGKTKTKALNNLLETLRFIEIANGNKRK